MKKRSLSVSLSALQDSFLAEVARRTGAFVEVETDGPQC